MDGVALSKILGQEVKTLRSMQFCSLWAGYGSIHTMTVTYLDATDVCSPTEFMLKVIQAPNDSGEAHDRKVRSYLVEAAFYRHFSQSAIKRGLSVARAYEIEVESDGNIRLLLEDLRSIYPISSSSMLRCDHTLAAVDWLARFHALHWEVVDSSCHPYNELWPEGCYWRLDTRMSEYEDIPSSWQRLKNCATVVADLLKTGTSNVSRKHRTLVHGDFKSPNILFSTSDNTRSDSACTCAAVDFQYVGAGYGARDLVMLIVSSVQMPSPYSHSDAVALEQQLLAAYHARLLTHLAATPTSTTSASRHADAAVEASYSMEQLVQHYELSLVDYVRFMAGWGMWGNMQYAETRTREILDRIDQGAVLTPAEYETRFRARFYWKHA